jgi:3-isopropylmalate dehydrogenase
MAGHMMLNYLGETEAAGLIERAVMTIVKDNMKSMDAGRMGMGTSEVGDLVANYIRDEE